MSSYLRLEHHVDYRLIKDIKVLKEEVSQPNSFLCICYGEKMQTVVSIQSDILANR